VKLRIAQSIAIAFLVSMHAGATEFQGAEVFTFSGDTNCPFAIGSDKNSCRRVALADVATRAEVLPEKHQILLGNSQKYAKKTLIADVFLPAKAKDEKGNEVPLILHAKISKTGNRSMTISAHGHAPVHGPFHAVTMESWQILADNGQKESKILFSEKQALSTLANPSLAARVAREFVDVQDNRPGNKQGKPDITIRVGLGKLSAPVMRSRLDAPESSNLDEFHHTLQSGSWSLQLEALSNSIPLAVAQHELFLYGLDQHPLVQTMRHSGFKKGDSLIVGAKNGEGYLSVGGQTSAFPAASQSAMRYMDISFIGLILAWQQLHPTTAYGK
jgi:hypothetical protein